MDGMSCIVIPGDPPHPEMEMEAESEEESDIEDSSSGEEVSIEAIHITNPFA